MGNRKPRKQKAFRHSTTFYRKLRQQLEGAKTLEHYYAVNKQPSRSVKGEITNPQAFSSPPVQVNSKNEPDNTGYDYMYFEETENGGTDGYYADDNNDNEDGFFVPTEDVLDTCDEEQHIVSQISLSEQLVTWHHLHKMTHSSLDDLLHILQSNGLNVPRDSRTLLKTPKSVSIMPMGNGQFWYNGIENCLVSTFSDSARPLSLSLVFNVDGLPPFRGSPIEFWPILFKIENMPQLQPMVAAIYCGITKPPLQEFLTQFTDELNHILQNGVSVNGQCKIKVKIKYFVCDTPARSFIKGTAGFNSAHGCIKCTVIGDYDRGGRHMSFPRIDCPLRTDESFRKKTDEDHHKEDSPLLKLPIDIVDDVIVADSLHLFDLGIMRKCLYGWVNGSYNFRTKWSATQINLISNMLEDCNARKPAEIHRAIRKLKCLKFWKGTEYRTFLLYIGSVVLKDFLSTEAYHNFLTLSCAVTILSCSTYLKYISIAECLLRDFIEQFIDIYGIDAISSNVHNACHVVNDVRKFGPLSEISSYPFENFLGHLKCLLHTGYRPLAQLAKRVNELSKFNSLSKQTMLPGSPFVKNENGNKENHELIYCKRIFNTVCIRDDFILSNDIKNKWFMTKNNEIVSMINATYYEEKICVYGSPVEEKTDFFEKPIRSSHLNIYKSDGTQVLAKLYSLNEIKCKLISLKYKDEFVFMPLIHTLDVEII